MPSRKGLPPPDVPAGVGLPLINSSGAFSFGSPPGDPEGRGDTTVVLADTVNWLNGHHSFQCGGETRRFYNNNLFENIGSFSFASLTNFLNDQAQSFTPLSGNANDKILEAAWGLFAQDRYKIRPNLTLSLGLRYDWNSTPTEANNRFSVFDPAPDALVQIGTPKFSQIYLVRFPSSERKSRMAGKCESTDAIRACLKTSRLPGGAVELIICRAGVQRASLGSVSPLNPSCQVNFVLIFTMTVRSSIMIALLSIGFLGVLSGQSRRKAVPAP